MSKIRNEIDPEVELIFGAIQDENMDGKIRVSIVATALDGHKPETKTVLNMVNRIQNRNPGYSDNLFKNTNIEQNPISSIEGATALKLDEQLEIKSSIQNVENHSQDISIENASYIENNLETDNLILNSDSSRENTPKLFSDDSLISKENKTEVDSKEIRNEKLFDQESIDDDDFEIPAFLRKQKF